MNNLTPGPRLGFSQTSFFLSGVTLRVFLSYFIFPFKNKTKISGDSKSFSKNQIFTKQDKNASFRHRVGTHRAKCEVHTHLLHGVGVEQLFFVMQVFSDAQKHKRRPNKIKSSNGKIIEILYCNYTQSTTQNKNILINF